MSKKKLSSLKEILIDGKIPDRILRELYQEAVEIEMGVEPHTIHPNVRRLGASDSLCARRALIGYVAPHLKKPFDRKTRRKFRVGDLFHKMADDGIDKVFWRFGGEIFRIPPFAVICFPDLFEGVVVPDHVHPLVGVDGTPDNILYAPSVRFLVLVDQKSANDYGFKKNRRSASIYHSVQVATYFNGLQNSPLNSMVDMAQCNMCYMSKEAIEIGTPGLTPTAHADAHAYWKMVADCLKSDDGKLPPALPREEWACRYCDFADSREDCEERLKTINDVNPEWMDEVREHKKVLEKLEAGDGEEG